MLKDKTMTYISLFSSAGVGCYGFHMEGFECVATNELLPRRMDVQRVNKKCKLDSGYIPGDITQPTIKQKIYFLGTTTNPVVNKLYPLKSLGRRKQEINGLLKKTKQLLLSPKKSIC